MVRQVPEKLRAFFTKNRSVAVAFSGGLDSRFLAHAARLCSSEALLVHVCGPHVPERESENAIDWAKARGFDFLEIGVNPLVLEEVAAGARNRCYFCKRLLFSGIREALEKRGQGDRLLCDGTNADDLVAYRPGLAALRELAVASPLALAGLSKPDIRKLAARLNLDRPDQLARPCLLTRFAYGLPPGREILQALAGAENEIEKFLESRGKGHIDFRLRIMPCPELHIQPEARSFAGELAQLAEKYGLGGCQIRIMESPRGYFDRLK